MLIFPFLLLWFAFWSAQAGYSMKFFDNKLQEWQGKIPSGNRVPELIIALTIGGIALWGWSQILPSTLVGVPAVVAFLVFSVMAFGGKESATWAYLPGSWRGFKDDKNNDGKIDEHDARKSTMWPVNVFLAKLVGQEFGDKYFSWVWAFTKGVFTTLPVGGTGGLIQPFSREIAFRIGGGDKGGKHQNFWMESLGDGTAYAAATTVFILIMG